MPLLCYFLQKKPIMFSFFSFLYSGWLMIHTFSKICCKFRLEWLQAFGKNISWNMCHQYIFFLCLLIMSKTALTVGILNWMQILSYDSATLRGSSTISSYFPFFLLLPMPHCTFLETPNPQSCLEEHREQITTKDCTPSPMYVCRSGSVMYSEEEKLVNFAQLFNNCLLWFICTVVYLHQPV